SPTSFMVSWSGSDDANGSGIAFYDVFVSDNGGPFTAFKTATTTNSATFTGTVGHTYGFYSVATDNVAHRQTTPTAAQATTTVSVITFLPTSSVAALPATESSVSFTLSWSGSDAGGPGITGYDVFVSDNGGPFTAFQTDTAAISAMFTGVNGHTYGFFSVAIDMAGNRQPTPMDAQATTTVNVRPPAPTAIPDTFVLGPTGPYSGAGATSVLANDTSADGQPQMLSAKVLSQPSNGTLSLHTDGSFTYSPGASFQGIDRFTYQVSEGTSAGNAVTVTLLSYNASLVDKLYEQVLHRPAEDGGLAYWTRQLDQGFPLDVVATGIFNSTERLNPLVTQFYQQYLGRNTDPGGLAYWVTDWQTKGDPRDVVENILASQEFFDDAGDANEGFINLLYQRVLMRTAELDGLNYWIGQMSPPANDTRLQIASRFYDTHEKHVDLVDFLFGGYFQGVQPLPPTAPYVTDLDNGETETQVEKAIIDSPAYSNNPPQPIAGSVGRSLYPH
ncbi:MAG TPA: DUF4214 domain-containing protein, partial [Gemmataceae bacterium]|nr:DUF4214 domain-containing protein [Gemmataceae bacterium]